MTDTSQLGIGVMINMLSGNADTITAIQSSLNKKIAEVKLDDNNLVFLFKDGTKLTLWDSGQSCCEHRFMTTDDDLAYYKNTILKGFELRDAPNVEDDGEYHEVQFLAVQTGKGEFVVASHNVSNGWYCGFSMAARMEPA